MVYSGLYLHVTGQTVMHKATKIVLFKTLDLTCRFFITKCAQDNTFTYNMRFPFHLGILI